MWISSHKKLCCCFECAKKYTITRQELHLVFFFRLNLQLNAFFTTSQLGWLGYM